jgi:hypothetical protein
MTNAIYDQNFVKTKLGVWCVDGVTTIPIAIDGATGHVKTDEVSTISYTPVPIAPRDENFQHVLLAQGTDGLAYPVNVNADGEILIDQ